MKSTLFKHAFILLCCIGILNYTAVVLHLYWTTWWWDMILHGLSGALVAIVFLSLWLTPDSARSIGKNKIFYTGILATLCIGVIWEIYELSIGSTMLSDGIAYVLDTTKDITMDIVGGFFGTWYAYSTIKKN